jgi:hypothetical protein
MFHSVRKPQEDEIGMFIAYKNRECRFKIIIKSYDEY